MYLSKHVCKILWSFVEHHIKCSTSMFESWKLRCIAQHQRRSSWRYLVSPQLPISSSFLPRTALPFGGFDKAPKTLTFEIPELNIAPEELEPLPSLQADIRSRPSFNRTPIGWVCSEDNSHIHMDLDNIPFDGETDDLWTRMRTQAYLCSLKHTHMSKYTGTHQHTHTWRIHPHKCIHESVRHSS